MNFQELKNKIIAWFWKMGYKLGNAVGLLGKGIVDDAFSSGFRDTAGTLSMALLILLLRLGPSLPTHNKTVQWELTLVTLKTQKRSLLR